jgi:serine phosphatase RsbU (regulator of sigma subunit)
MDSLVVDRPAVASRGAGPISLLAPQGETEKTDLRDLVAHCTSVSASCTLEQVHELFSTHAVEFMAVLDGDNLIGMCARREIGMLLGSRYGFSLFGRRSVSGFVCNATLRIVAGTPISKVLRTVFSRDDATFYDDVLLVDSAQRFIGLISTQSLVRLENRFLMENIHRLEDQSRLLNAKNEQMEADLCMARELQQALLPGEYPTFPPGCPAASSSIQFVHRYQPSGNVGGDFFHVIPLSDNSAGVFICDVMGHGVRSALVTAMLRALVEELAPGASDPGQLMTLINRELTKILQQTGAALFATALYTIIDSEAQHMRYAIAGHPFPVHVRRHHGSADFLHARMRPGPALGLFPLATYDTRECDITPGDLIVLFTDGLFEVDGPNDEEFGAERLLESVSRSLAKPSAEIVNNLFAEIDVFSAGRGFTDDVCLVGLELLNGRC